MGVEFISERHADPKLLCHPVEGVSSVRGSECAHSDHTERLSDRSGLRGPPPKIKSVHHRCARRHEIDAAVNAQSQAADELFQCSITADVDECEAQSVAGSNSPGQSLTPVGYLSEADLRWGVHEARHF